MTASGATTTPPSGVAPLEYVLAENHLWCMKLSFSDDNLFPMTRMSGPQEVRWSDVISEPPMADFLLASSPEEVWVLCKRDIQGENNQRLASLNFGYFNGAELGPNTYAPKLIGELPAGMKAPTKKKLLRLYRIPLQLGSLRFLAQEAFLHYRPPMGMIRPHDGRTRGIQLRTSPKQERNLAAIHKFLALKQISTEYFRFPNSSM